MSFATRVLDPEVVEFGNGLRVFLVENHATPSVSLNLTILAGARDEPEELAGVATMTSRLLDEGTERRTSFQIAQAIEAVGGVLETDCSFDRSGVFLGVLSRDLELGIDLMADIVQRPVFAQESLGNERERTLAEIRSAMDRPQVVALWEFNEMVYGKHPLHRPVHGYPETISRLTTCDLRRFHGQYIVPENAILSVVGDFDPREVLGLLDTAFGAWTRGTQVVRRAYPPPTENHGIRSRFLPLHSQQVHIYLGHLGVARNHPDYYVLQVMDSILGAGAGLTARIPHKLRDEQGLAYTTFASITSSAGSDPGKFLAYMATSPEHVDAAIDGFLEEIDRMRSEPVLDEELNDAQAYLTGSFVFAFDTNAQVARFLINAEVFQLGFDYVARYPGYIEGVTREAVQRAALAHLSTDNYVLVVGGPEAVVSDHLARGGGLQR